jgi:hypothetical protein
VLARAESLAGAGGPYALQAAIACRTRATRADQTDWARIAEIYPQLTESQPSPVGLAELAVEPRLDGARPICIIVQRTHRLLRTGSSTRYGSITLMSRSPPVQMALVLHELRAPALNKTPIPTCHASTISVPF